MLGFMTIASLHFLAVIMPGPDFAIVVRSAVCHSRQQAIWTSLGVAVGILVHLTYCITGLALVIAKSVVVFKIIKYLGATYLLYVGIKSLTSTINPNIVIGDENQRASRWLSFRDGVLCNVLNPKSTLFFLSLFSLVISPKTPLWLQCLYGSEMFIATFLWFTFLSIIITKPKFKQQLCKVQEKITKFMGVIFIAFAVKLLFITV